MPASPYRTPAPAPNPQEPPAAARLDGDGELVPLFAIVWLASITRVVQGVSRAETFGAELTLACFAVVLLPLAAREGVRALLRLSRPARAEDSGDPT
jgi:hypothetical protein